MKLDTKHFGQHEGKAINLYIMENDNGMRVKIMNYGATITSIEVPGKDGNRIELTCGFDGFEGYFSEAYRKNAPYFGCTVGRYASVIKDARFELDGTEYKLPANMDPHHLHGGLVGFDKKVWKAESFENEGGIGVVMSLRSPHMDQGYPGNLDVSVRFLLNNENEIRINYEANTDRPTPVSLTNHTYFNLSGFRENLENHQARILSGSFLAPDETGGITEGKLTAVEGTDADLRSGKPLRDVFSSMEKGFEHYFIFDKSPDTLELAAEIEHAPSGRKLEVFTTEPGMLFYTGRYTSDELKRENGDRYGFLRAFCCETHRYQNGPNIENSPGTFTDPGKKFSSTTVFRISW